MKKSQFHHNPRIHCALASAIAAMLATQSAQAAAGTWNVDANGIWSLNTNWLNSIIADSAAANFTNNITADRTVSLNSARTITSLVFGDSNTSTAGSWILDNNGNAANTLTGLTAITVNALGAGKTATISAVIAGSTSRIELNGSGGGTLVLAGANTFNFATNNANFGWRLNAGSTVVVASDSAFGVSTGTDFNATTLVNLNGGTLQASGSARTVANPIWLNGSTTVVSGSQSLTFSGAAMGRGSNPTVTNNITGGGTLSFTGKVYTDQTTGFKVLTFNGTGNTLISGVIANNTGNVAGQNGSIIKSGAGTLTLSNTASTYTGATQILASVMEVSALANGGTASSIGQSTNAASNLVFGAPTATLRYNGSSNSTTNRGFTLSSGAGGGATIESSGSGTLTIDNTVAMAYGTTDQTRLLTLGGTNTGANTFSKVIANNGSGATTLTKAGAGKWFISSTNTYTGATNVNAGTLAITGSGSINASSGVNVAAGANFVYNSSTTMTNSISLSGAGTSSRAILGGAGTIGATVALNDLGDTLSPGNSPGIQTFTQAQTWSSFSYDWEVNNFTGTTAGTDFDQLGLNTLNLTGGAGSYILNVLSLTASNDAGNVPNFSEINNSWTILTSSTGITGFNAANWSINTSGFIDPATGTWSLAQSGNNLVLSYNVIPEPNVAALIGGLGVLLILRRRR
jgi:fibronectin-binding autotransporter adhesin